MLNKIVTNKVLITVSLVLLVGLLWVYPMAAQSGETPDDAPLRLITVSGNAEVRVTPDEVVLTLGVETWDKNLDVAKRENDRIVKAVLDLAKTYDIPSRYVQTDYINIEPRYDYMYEKREFIGYFVTKTIVITLKDISQFEDFLSDVLETGVNYVHGIQFRTTELRKHKDQARELAIQAAREKAEALAGSLGQEIGEPHMIREDAVDWWSGYGAWWSSTRGGMMSQNIVQEFNGGTALMEESSLAPGQLNVNARVTVSFAMENPRMKR